MASKHEITDEQWVSEMLRFSQANDPGLTMREWAAKWDVSDRTALFRIRRAVEAGLMSVGRRAVTRIDGVGGVKPVYRVVKKAKQGDR